MEETTGLSIVIAEDDTDDANIIIKSFIRHEAFKKVTRVKNGQELIDYLNDNKSNLPDIVLTDINMPIKNGVEALSDIFHDSALCKIPVFIYSSTISPMYERKCKELGCKACLIKPFSIAEFDDIPYQIVYKLK